MRFILGTLARNTLMVEIRGSGPRPLKVFVKPGSKAQSICRGYAARGEVSEREVPPQSEAAAPGFSPRPALNLHDHGGKIISDLVYTNFFVGGTGWRSQDRENIDENLEKAMIDQGLNNVLIQYFRGAPNITSTFRPSALLPGDPPDSISQPQVEQLVQQLHRDGKLNGFDFENTLFNFMLPRGTVLTIDDGSGDQAGSDEPERKSGETEEKASSLEGLGGFHGSVRASQTRIYYSVGVFSERDNGIVAFDVPWKNVVATFYHELVEARTDADVEDGRVAWVNNERPSAEIGDIPMSLAGRNLSKVMKEVPLSDGSGTVPIQLMWSNAVSAPEGPIPSPHLGPLVA